MVMAMQRTGYESETVWLRTLLEIIKFCVREDLRYCPDTYLMDDKHIHI